MKRSRNAITPWWALHSRYIPFEHPLTCTRYERVKRWFHLMGWIKRDTYPKIPYASDWRKS